MSTSKISSKSSKTFSTSGVVTFIVTLIILLATGLMVGLFYLISEFEYPGVEREMEVGSDMVTMFYTTLVVILLIMVAVRVLRRRFDFITVSDDAVFCQDKHGTRTLHFLIDVLYALHEVLFAGDHERDELGGVRRTGAQFGELLVAVEALLFQLLDIVDFGYCRDGKSTQMRVHHDGLRVGVADDADAGVALELAEVVGEFRPEIAVLNVVNGTAEQLRVLLVGDNTAALGSEMGVIVHPVEKVRNTRFGRDDPEKSAHRSVAIVLIIKKIPVRDVRL